MSQNDNDTWYFNPGRKQKYTNQIIQLSDLHAITESLIVFKKKSSRLDTIKNCINEMANTYYVRRSILLSTTNPDKLTPTCVTNMFTSPTLSFNKYNDNM